MKARESKSKAEAKKPTPQTQAKVSNFSSPGSIQAKADSTSADSSSSLSRPNSMISNVSKTLQKKSEQARIQMKAKNNQIQRLSLEDIMKTNVVPPKP